MAKYAHQPVMDKTDISYIPPEEDPLSRPMVVAAPCVCDDSHTWLVEIPPTAWRLVTRLGEGGLAGQE